MESAQVAQQLIQRLAQLYPDYNTAELLRIGLLVALHRPELGDCEGVDLREFGGISEYRAAVGRREHTGLSALQEYCQEVSLQMSAASDQHAAVADELDSLAATTPCDFSPSHIWTLVRAIKVQSQVLHLYLGPVESTI